MLKIERTILNTCPLPTFGDFQWAAYLSAAVQALREMLGREISPSTGQVPVCCSGVLQPRWNGLDQRFAERLSGVLGMRVLTDCRMQKRAAACVPLQEGSAVLGSQGSCRRLSPHALLTVTILARFLCLTGEQLVLGGMDRAGDQILKWSCSSWSCSAEREDYA